MSRSYDQLLEHCIYNAPLALLSIKDKESIQRINELLPYSTGFEIECHAGDKYDHTNFKSIPYIMDYPAQFEKYEFRFRIPYGYDGLLCLYCISEQCKLNLKLNPGSGTHHHVDMTDVWNEIDSKGMEETLNLIRGSIEQELMTELDTWKTGCGYPRKIGIGKGYWMGLRDGHKTMEFRTGNMTFDYKEMVTCIISANKNVRKVKNLLIGEELISQIIKDKDTTVNPEVWLEYFKTNNSYGKAKKKIETFKKELLSKIDSRGNTANNQPDLNDINQLIKRRVQ